MIPALLKQFQAPLWVNAIYQAALLWNRAFSALANLSHFRFALMDRYCQCAICQERRAHT